MRKILIICSFLFILAAIAITAPENTASTSEHKVISPSDLQWGDAPPSLPPGAKMAVLDGDPTVVSGSFRIGMGDKLDEANAPELGPGSFVVMPAGMKHFAMASAESIIQINSEGPFQINYVNPADDPRNAKK